MKMKKTIGIILMTAFLAGAIFSGIMFAQQYGDAKQSEEAFSELQELIQEPASNETDPVDEDESPSIEETETPAVQTSCDKYLPLYEKNNDFIGWISIEGTNVDYPVMHTPYDPNFYLKHNFEKVWSDYGVPYIDGECAVGQSNNLVIYGHHMKNGTMFRDIVKYADKGFWEEHPVIRFDTLEDFGVYEVIAAFRFDTNHDEFRYNKLHDLDEKAFEEYVANCMDRSIYDTGKTATFGDQLITLSTCEYTYENGRFVVVAKKVVE